MLRRALAVGCVLLVLGPRMVAGQPQSIPNKLLDLSESGSGILLAGTDGAGVFVSRDGGATWLPAGLEGKEVAGVALLSNGTWIAGVRSFFGGGVLVSTDSGAKWIRVGSSRKVQAMAVVTSGGNWFALSGIAGGGAAVMDAKGDWRGSRGNGCVNVDAVAFLGDGTMFAGGPCGLIRSSGDPTQWTKMLADVVVTAIATAYTPEKSLVLVGTTNGIVGSTDGGRTFRSVSAGLPSPMIRTLAIDSSGTAWAATDGGAAVRLPNATSWAPIAGAAGKTRTVFVTQAGGAVFVQREDGHSMKLDRSAIILPLTAALAAAQNKAQAEKAATAATEVPAMTNDEVLKLVGAGLSEQVVAMSIKQAAKVNFDLSITALIALKNAKVPDAVVQAMQARAGVVTPP